MYLLPFGPSPHWGRRDKLEGGKNGKYSQLVSMVSPKSHSSHVISRPTIKFLRLPLPLVYSSQNKWVHITLFPPRNSMLSHGLSVSLNGNHNPNPDSYGLKPSGYASSLNVSVDFFLYDCSLRLELPTQFLTAWLVYLWGLCNFTPDPLNSFYSKYNWI